MHAEKSQKQSILQRVTKLRGYVEIGLKRFFQEWNSTSPDVNVSKAYSIRINSALLSEDSRYKTKNNFHEKFYALISAAIINGSQGGLNLYDMFEAMVSVVVNNLYLELVGENN